MIVTENISQNKKYNLIVWSIILLFYITGAIGMRTAKREMFLSLTPLLLLASSAALFFTRKDRRPEFSWFVLFVFFAGFFVEMLGVNSGFPFGHYSYGETLGPKLAGTPIVIGINWILVILMTGAIAQMIFNNKILALCFGALLTTLLDVLIEPSAIHLGYWQWESGNPPLQNYIAWLALSLLFHSGAVVLDLRFRSEAALPLFTGNLIFFITTGYLG